MIRRTGWSLAVLWPLLVGSVHADPQPARPTIKTNRWQEDWSVLKDPALRTQPLDNLKYIPLSSANPFTYLSLGATLRERFEMNDASGFGVKNVARTNTGGCSPSLKMCGPTTKPQWAGPTRTALTCAWRSPNT